MLMMPETVKINPLLFQVPLQQSTLTSSQQPLTSGLYQRQPRAANPVTNRAIRRHIREQESSPNESTSMTPRTSSRNRSNRFSAEIENGIRFEDPLIPPAASPEQQQKHQHRSKQSRSTSNSKSEEKSVNKNEETRSQSQLMTRRDWRRQRAYSNEWDLLEDDKEEFGGETRGRNLPERKSIGGVGGLSRGRQNKPGPMETLDRRISASSDQLDTLKREKKSERSVWGLPPDNADHGRHSRLSRPHTSASCHVKRPRSATRHNHPELDLKKTDKIEENNNEEITIDYRGEKMSKSRYFFGDILNKSSGPSSGTSGNSDRAKSRLGFLKEDRQTQQQKARKTAVDIFLEDAGPYSRKLYGPPPKESSTAAAAAATTTTTKEAKSGLKNGNSKRARSQEIIPEASEEFKPGDFCPLKKGLLWQQRDKLFSRWKERYFVLTKDYFHCFKKATSKITEMGGFIFKLKLVDIDSVDLLDKRGYLTICMSVLKEGKIYLRRPEGIRDWYNALQSNIYESKRRRKFWVKRQVTDSSNIEQWLLARQKVGIHYPSAAGSSPNLLESTMSGARNLSRPGTAAGVDHDSGNDDEEDRPEVAAEKENKADEEPRVVVVGPRGINRLNLVTELIMKEKLTTETCPTSKASPDLSSGDSLLGDSSSSSARSSMQSSSAGPASSMTSPVESSTSKAGVTATSKEISARVMQHRRLDDSGNDSGHNSMNTNSDTQSDSTNSSGEEAGRPTVPPKSLAVKNHIRTSDFADKKASSATALAHGLNVRVLVDDSKSLTQASAAGYAVPNKHLAGPKPLVTTGPKSLAATSSKSVDSDLLLSSSLGSL